LALAIEGIRYFKIEMATAQTKIHIVDHHAQTLGEKSR
jgi:hypothetical protein